MALMQAKQIDKVMAGFVQITGFSAVGVDDVATTAITTACTTAGNGGVSVPVQISSGVSGIGVITTAGLNKSLIFDNTTKAKIDDGAGNEVYARITEAAGVYTISYYSLVAGTETAFTMPATTVDFEFSYRFDFNRYPSDAGIAIKSRNVADDINVGQGTYTVESLTITATNTVNALSFLPNGTVFIHVNGKSEENTSGGAFSLVAKAITWSPANSGYDLETTDRAIAEYFTLQ